MMSSFMFGGVTSKHSSCHNWISMTTGDTSTSQCCLTQTLRVVRQKKEVVLTVGDVLLSKRILNFWMCSCWVSFIWRQKETGQSVTGLRTWGAVVWLFEVSESAFAKPHTPPQKACPSHLFKVWEFVLLRSVFTSSCSSSKSSDADFIVIFFVLQCGGGGSGNAAVTTGNHYLH